MNYPELKPCPFCGGKAIETDRNIEIGFKHTKCEITITCTNCGIQLTKTHYYSNYQDSIFINNKSAYDLWNRRVNDER